MRSTVFALLACAQFTALGQTYDLVFAGGRVIDPETKAEAIRAARARSRASSAVTSASSRRSR